MLECPNPNLTYSLNLLSDVSRFISVDSAFYIFGPKIFKLLSPYVTILWLLVIKLCGRTQAFYLLVKIFFRKSGFKLLTVLNISIASCFIFLICMVDVPLFIVTVIVIMDHA